MFRSTWTLALLCVSCGAPEQPAAPAVASPTQAVVGDDAKRKLVLEVAGKVDAIRTAAGARDWDTLRAQMCEDFDFGGATRGRDGALASWRDDPTRLDTLVRVLDGDCAADDAGARWSCRPRAGSSDAQHELVSLTHDGARWSWCVFAKSG